MLGYRAGQRSAAETLGLTKSASTRAVRELLAAVRRTGVKLPKRPPKDQTWLRAIEEASAATRTTPEGWAEHEKLRQLVNDYLPAIEASPAPSASTSVWGENRTWPHGYYKPSQTNMHRLAERVSPRGVTSRPQMEAVGQLDTYARQAWSGRHAPRPDETFIPGAWWGEVTADQTPNAQYLFRGNRPSVRPEIHSPAYADAQGTPGVFVSGHPDVAAAYAAGGLKQYTPAEAELYAFDRRSLPGSLGPAAADQHIPKKPTEVAVKRYLREADPLGDKTLGPGYYSPNAHVRDYARRAVNEAYEEIVPVNQLDFDNPAGRYRVRKSRHPVTGAPGYAVATVAGTPAAELFKK